jgi:hypothetical protein
MCFKNAFKNPKCLLQSAHARGLQRGFGKHVLCECGCTTTLVHVGMTNHAVSRPPRRARAAAGLSCILVMWYNGGREVVRQTPKRPSLTSHHPRIVLLVGDGLGCPLARMRSRMRPAYLPKESALGGCGHLPSVGAKLPPTGCGRSGGATTAPLSTGKADAFPYEPLPGDR